MRQSDDESGGPRIHVLVVDDDLGALKSLEGVLLTGFDVSTSSSPLDALATARLAVVRKTPFDVICSDYRMPRMDGMELLRHMAELPERPGCILITGYSDMLQGKHSRATHIQGIVVKPYDPEHVIGLVGRLGRMTRLKRSISVLGERVGVKRP